MLRSFLIGLSKIKWVQRLITDWPFAWRFASRFISGETPHDAVQAIRMLNAQGMNATVDHLGENVTSPQEAAEATEEIIHMLETIQQSGVRANVSVKLSQLGLAMDPKVCHNNLRRILEKAAELDNFIRMDMEDSSLTSLTLDCYRWAVQQGFTNTGVVIQSYLYRSEEDIRDLGNYPASVRLCKGAYKEPADIAFQKKSQVDENFDKLTDILLEISQSNEAPEVTSKGRTPPIPCIATHDETRIQHALNKLEEMGLPAKAIEFQFLYGIRQDLHEKLASQGFPVRIYVPYGTSWYPYYMRRLAERPANLWFFLTNLFRQQ
jgi:proline dehydrogenase